MFYIVTYSTDKNQKKGLIISENNEQLRSKLTQVEEVLKITPDARIIGICLMDPQPICANYEEIPKILFEVNINPNELEEGDLEMELILANDYSEALSITSIKKLGGISQSEVFEFIK